MEGYRVAPTPQGRMWTRLGARHRGHLRFAESCMAASQPRVPPRRYVIETSSSRRGRWAVCFRRLWSAARGQPGGLGGTALRRADAARPARGRVRRRAVPAMLRWVLHPLGDGRRRSQLQLLQLRRRGDSLAPMTAAASAAAPRALRARVCRVADSSPRPSTTSFFVRQIPSRFSTCWRIFLARRMPSSPRRCARHPPRR